MISRAKEEASKQEDKAASLAKLTPNQERSLEVHAQPLTSDIKVQSSPKKTVVDISRMVESQ